MKNILITAAAAAIFMPPVFSLSATAEGIDASATPAKTEKASRADAAETKYLPKEAGHEMGSVTGTGIEMKVYDHAVAGAVGDALAWGFFDESKGVSRLILRKYGQTVSAEFKRHEDKSLGGTIESGEGSFLKKTSVFFAGADMPSKTFKLKINGEEVVVSISAEKEQKGHFVNPTYSAVLGGKKVSYRIEAEGCMGYSIQMGMLILGAYAH